MELIDAIQPYLGTETILIIDSEEHWLSIYNKLRKESSLKFKKHIINAYKPNDFLAIFLKEKGYETQGNLKYFKEYIEYKNYKFIHTSELIEFNNWLW